MSDMMDLQQQMMALWPKAQLHWSHYILLSDPIHDEDQPSLAQIHLGTRQVALNFSQIEKYDIASCLEALLAHEIGHHVRYPATLVTQARMRLIEKNLIPIEDYSLINLFTDLMINEHIGHALSDQLVKIYTAFQVDIDWQDEPAFMFYLAVYEELWQLVPGQLMGKGFDDFFNAYPGFRADAQLLAQNIFYLGPNIFTQFLYFISVFSRYIKPVKQKTPDSQNPYACHADEPSPEDWAQALNPNAREKEAIQKAINEGWVSADEGHIIQNDLYRRIMGLPGVGSPDAGEVPEIMAAYYRQQAERYRVHPPAQKMLGEAVVPTNLVDWQPTDPVKEIDWLSTLLQNGEQIGLVQPLKREKIAEFEGFEVPLWQPMVEIYLDVSGSMPDPRYSLNAMTLAAQILVMGATRAGGRVRILMYSVDTVEYWQWSRSEIALSKFLMHYIGGGTQFPFNKLQNSVKQCEQQPTRVVISDHDFQYNFDNTPHAHEILTEAISCSHPMILLLNCGKDDVWPDNFNKIGAQVIKVFNMDDFPNMAAQLSHALFYEGKVNA